MSRGKCTHMAGEPQLENLALGLFASLCYGDLSWISLTNQLFWYKH